MISRIKQQDGLLGRVYAYLHRLTGTPPWSKHDLHSDATILAHLLVKLIFINYVFNKPAHTPESLCP